MAAFFGDLENKISNAAAVRSGFAGALFHWLPNCIAAKIAHCRASLRA